MSQTQTHAFQAEVQQVLQLVIHSLYSHKEIFLRELISNASDACDKLRFEALANPELSASDSELRIEIEVDEQARTLTVRDNGIGMSRDEALENLGTIARSGTRRFLESMSGDARKDAQLIGQFGVGFYSAFIVAERIEVRTRRAGLDAAEGVRWASAGTGEFELETIERAQRGTEVVLTLKAEESEFLDLWQLRQLIRRYSDHIAFPIRIPKPVESAEADDEASDADKPTADSPVEWETINHASALWTRPKAELEDEDYQAFYKHLNHGVDEALLWSHNRVEGNQAYTSLLYVPSKAPFDQLWSDRNERKGLKLYIRRVFIMDASEQLLPAYLRFVRGVVDSDDLPLNVSRELLQDNRLVSQIRAACTKRVLDMLEKLATDDPTRYQQFFDAFGNVLKEGLAEDFGNRERIAGLLRFASTKGDGSTRNVSLKDYVDRLQPDQTAIYFVTADSYKAAAGSPQIEALKAREVEVLLLFDRIDEWMVSYLHEFDGKPLKHVAKGALESQSTDTEALADAGEHQALVDRLGQLLGDRVKAVRPSQRLVESPACLVLDEHAMALHMQRLMREAGHEIPVDAPVLEINTGHPLLQRLEAETDEARATDLALLLHEQAVVAEGGQLEDPAAFVQRMNRVISGLQPAAA
ncbi:MAG: molecular chaperone HtpG [Xanthomonadales bacterium]|nr:molecular chaperone HtpG [Xanthomonadales bacterium]